MTIDDVHIKYEQLNEMQNIIEKNSDNDNNQNNNQNNNQQPRTTTTTTTTLFPPMQNDLSLLHLLNTIRKTSAVFTYDEFGQVKDTLTYIKHVQAFFQHKPNRDEFPRLTEAAGGRVYVDPELLERLSKAFEGATGQVSCVHTHSSFVEFIVFS